MFDLMALASRLRKGRARSEFVPIFMSIGGNSHG
jgi:hypothetical protein